MHKFWFLLMIFVSMSPTARADDIVASKSNESSVPVDSSNEMDSYALTAGLVDLGLVTGGLGLALWQVNRPTTPYRSHTPWGLGIAGAGLFFGGSFTHGLYGNMEARGPSVWLRVKHLGLGAVMGCTAGGLAGLGTMLACALGGGGYCEMALGFGLIAGTFAGTVGGLGRGLYLDYSTLAHRPAPATTARVTGLRPHVGLAPDGQLRLGLSGGF